jgi:hypothetical protein
MPGTPEMNDFIAYYKKIEKIYNDSNMLKTELVNVCIKMKIPKSGTCSQLEERIIKNSNLCTTPKLKKILHNIQKHHEVAREYSLYPGESCKGLKRILSCLKLSQCGSREEIAKRLVDNRHLIIDMNNKNWKQLAEKIEYSGSKIAFANWIIINAYREEYDFGEKTKKRFSSKVADSVSSEVSPESFLSSSTENQEYKAKIKTVRLSLFLRYEDFRLKGLISHGYIERSAEVLNIKQWQIEFIEANYNLFLERLHEILKYEYFRSKGSIVPGDIKKSVRILNIKQWQIESIEAEYEWITETLRQYKNVIINIVHNQIRTAITREGLPKYYPIYIDLFPRPDNVVDQYNKLENKLCLLKDDLCALKKLTNSIDKESESVAEVLPKMPGIPIVEECPICYEPLANNAFCTLNCQHKICLSCYNQLQKKTECPYCRGSIH